MAYVIDPPVQPFLTITGSDNRFPIHRIYCVGRNYAEHTREMGGDPEKSPPFFFQKNPDNVVLDGKFPYPSETKDVHWETELVVALKAGGSNIDPKDALSRVYGYAVGIDMTRRDLQSEAKKLGRPWEYAKAFEKSAPCSSLVPAEKIGHPSKGAITLEVNGERRQSGDISEMIWDVPHIIAFLSKLWVLQPGDVIMTGTPAGVGATKKGDRMKAQVAGVGTLEVTVV